MWTFFWCSLGVLLWLASLWVTAGFYYAKGWEGGQLYYARKGYKFHKGKHYDPAGNELVYPSRED